MNLSNADPRPEASERSNAQTFLIELSDLLGVPRPTNAPQAEQTDLQLAAALAIDGAGKKKSRPVRGSDAWDDAMWRAKGQAKRYARHLPAREPAAPFLLVVDVGHSIEIYADFTQAGRAYQAFPDTRNFRVRLEDLREDFRVRLEDLREEKVRERLRGIWMEPRALDPAKISAEITREIAGYLATLAASLEAAGHPPRLVAEFLTRCLFCMSLPRMLVSCRRTASPIFSKAFRVA